MALSQVSASLAFPNSGAIKLATIANRSSSTCRVHVPQLAGSRSSFASGSPLLPLKLSVIRRGGNRAATVSVRSEQSTEGSSGLDIWLGRGAMIGFAVALTVEITTGKGLLENFGVASPLPTVALAVTALVGVLTAVFIFQSSSKN
ncbi:PREDICTED: stress enhanced protein 1, chloroplastic-like isoform X1 [Camelina sativa]|uniref:Stress enhanced protein 1, chloroplastic-like isoform X1 n=1 Tax=Camelina sativa TaxID=90675 RepID=A0ABM0TWE2_CAMSA|nr:PREDICTED: stress enhanced protein 1, chloroplastic-like isoform X1 [Camelina sativa]